MTQWNFNALQSLITGGTVLAAGGGGGYVLGLQTLTQHIPLLAGIESASVSELDAQGWLLCGAGMGSPTAGMSISDLAAPVIEGYPKMENFCTYNQSNPQYSKVLNGFSAFSYFHPMEIGAVNLAIAAVTAYKYNRLLIDADPAGGRSLPDLSLTAFAGAGFPIAPNMLASAPQKDKGEQVVTTVIDTLDTNTLQASYAKLIPEVYEGEGGFMLYPMTGATLATMPVNHGSLLKAKEVGEIFRNNTTDKAACAQAVVNYLTTTGQQSRVIFEGNVTSIYVDTQDDTDAGYITVALGSRVLTIYMVNENLYAQFNDQTSPYILSPDSICYIGDVAGDTQADAIPLDNSALADLINTQHKEVYVYILGVSAPQNILDNTRLMENWRSYLASLPHYAYDGPFAQPWLSDSEG